MSYAKRNRQDLQTLTWVALFSAISGTKSRGSCVVLERTVSLGRKSGAWRLYIGKRREAWDEHGFAAKMAGRARQAGLWVGALALLLSTRPAMDRPLLTALGRIPARRGARHRFPQTQREAGKVADFSCSDSGLVF